MEAGWSGGLADLVRRLDSGSESVADGATEELIDLGRDVDVVAPLVQALPTMRAHGQWCAVEVLEEFDDRRADEALIELLAGGDQEVRERAAGALGRLGVVEAVPALRRAHEASRVRHGGPDWSERLALLHALTALGAHHPVTPALTASLRRTAANGWAVWPSTRLVELIDDLADNSQAVLHVQFWRVEPDGRMLSSPYRCGVIALDLDQPWPDLVAQARSRAAVIARFADIGDAVVTSIDWIDQTDLTVIPEPRHT